MSLEFTLSFKGSSADSGLLDFSDAAAAFSAFHRSLSLTANLAINGDINTRAAGAEDIQILTYPPTQGSWKAAAIVAGTLLVSGSVASRDSVLGHIFTSIYDYALNELLGFHVDFELALGKQIEDHKRLTHGSSNTINREKIYSLIEAMDKPAKELHRPIYRSHTAQSGEIWLNHGGAAIKKTGPTFDIRTFEYIESIRPPSIPKTNIKGRIFSYDIEFHRGLLRANGSKKSEPFVLEKKSRTIENIEKIVNSLRSNAIDKFKDNAEIQFVAEIIEWKSGRTIQYIILDIA